MPPCGETDRGQIISFYFHVHATWYLLWEISFSFSTERGFFSFSHALSAGTLTKLSRKRSVNYSSNPSKLMKLLLWSWKDIPDGPNINRRERHVSTRATAGCVRACAYMPRCVRLCVCVRAHVRHCPVWKSVLTIMGIFNLNQATAAIKRCCHGNEGGREAENRMTVRRLDVVWEREEEEGWEGGGWGGRRRWGWMTNEFRVWE